MSVERLHGRASWPALAIFCAAAALPAQQPEEEPGPLTAAEVVRLYGSSVVLIRAELPADQERLGSGFFVSPDGVVATSLHLLEGATAATVRVGGRSWELSRVRAFDLGRDLAVLQIDGEGFVDTVLGHAAALDRGAAVFVIGNPLGLAGTVSEGLLAAWREPGLGLDEPEIMAQLGILAEGRLMQISAPISHGSSGAPVFDERGRVVAVVAATVGQGALDLNFAVPVEVLVPLLDRDEGWDLASLATTLNRQRRDLAEPHLVDARFHLANEDPAAAVKALDRALGIFPGSGEALTLKGRVLLGAGQLDEAEALFRQAVQANPDSAVAWENLGLFVLEHGSTRDRAEAVGALDRALEIDPWRAGAAFGLGIARLRQGDLDEARAMLQQAVDADREHLDAWVGLGAVCLMMDDAEGAKDAFESALWLDEANARAVCGLATIYGAQGDFRASEYGDRCEALSQRRR